MVQYCFQRLMEIFKKNIYVNVVYMACKLRYDPCALTGVCLFNNYLFLRVINLCSESVLKMSVDTNYYI